MPNPMSELLRSLIHSAIGDPSSADEMVSSVEAGANAIPDMTGQTGKFLSNNGTDTIWSPGDGTGTVTNVATGTGLTGGPITTTGTISLADTAVTPGSFTNADITVDAQGRITAAANGTSATPGGADTQIQFNDGGSFGGDSAFVWDKTNNFLGVGDATTPITAVHVKDSTTNPFGQVTIEKQIAQATFNVGGTLVLKRASDSAGSPSPVASADTIGTVNWNGYDGTAVTGYPASSPSRILVSATEAWTTSAHGNSMQFWNTNNGSATRKVAGQFNPDSSLSIFNSSGGQAISIASSGGSIRLTPQAGSNFILNNGELRMNGATSGFSGFKSAGTAPNVTWTLPSADGSSRSLFLKTNGSATLSFADAHLLENNTPFFVTKNAGGTLNAFNLNPADVLWLGQESGYDQPAVAIDPPNGTGGVNIASSVGGFVATHTERVSIEPILGATVAPVLRLSNTANSFSIGIKAHDTLAANETYTLPTVDGSNGDVLTTDGSGQMSWTTPSGGASTWAATSLFSDDAVTTNWGGTFPGIQLPVAGGSWFQIAGEDVPTSDTTTAANSIEIIPGSIMEPTSAQSPGSFYLQAGNTEGTAKGGGVDIFGGYAQSGEGGTVVINAGESDSGLGGEVVINGGDSTSGTGGKISMYAGTGTGSVRGFIQMTALYLLLPRDTSDPTAPAGSVYYNTGTNKLKLYDGSTWVVLNP